jgi:hypothetical protein
MAAAGKCQHGCIKGTTLQVATAVSHEQTGTETCGDQLFSVKRRAINHAWAGVKLALLGWLAASQQCFSLTPVQHQPLSTSQPAVFFSHNKSASATSHQPAERGQELGAILRACLVQQP